MERKRKLLAAKIAVVGAVIPILLWAYEYGPNPGYCGVPGEHLGATCTASGCHSGTTNNPANKGSVAATFSGGLTYVPGQTQQVTVTISDPAQAAWGFQLTARVSASPSTVAGSFAPTDPNTEVMCSTPDLQIFGAVCLPGGAGPDGRCTESAAPACPANRPLSYAEHSYTGYLQTRGPGSGTYQFNWTPPATNVGNITVYLAGNAGVGGPPNVNGDHIYATTYTLTPASGGGSAPTITGVANAAGGQPGVFPNAYLSIYGSNFAPAGFTDDWGKSVVNGQLPTALDNVSVMIGSQPAYVSYLSSGQINVLAPPNLGLGSMQVTVTANGSTSDPFAVTSQQYGPAFFPWPNGQPVATHTDYTWAVANGTFSGVTTVPAKPGEAIILWGTGFGPTSPAAPVGAEVPASPTDYTASPVTMTIGGTPAPVYATALASSFAGLYQVVVTVPASLANGSYPILATINGANSPTGVILAVHN